MNGLWKVRTAETQWQKIFVQPAIGVVGRPSRNILEHANGSNPSIIAEVKPVPRSPRHPQQIAGFHFNADNATFFEMNMEKSMTGNDESNFIFIMPMLTIKLCEHFRKAGRFGAHIDHISSDVATTAFQLFDLVLVGA